MAQFKLSLINLNYIDNNNIAYYFKQPISEFYDQRTEYLSKQSSSPKYSYCYTQNEVFNETTNSQKSLSFTMDRKIVRDDRIEDNPFVYNIHIGSQLLLEDKYNRHHLLTVSNIKYDFKELNLVYTYECQDSFTWQLSRQNDGYTITNEISSEDFLGARKLDDWANKICTECNVVYNYVHNKQLDSIQDFTKTIIFSGSGTADSMLISLGEKYGLQIQVFERFQDDCTIKKEFKYVPLKSLSSSGLKYSPYHDIQSFGLNHSGTALSSVLNVRGGEIGKDIVSLIPSVPSFFRNWFTTDDWRNSKFIPGIFSSKCQSESINIVKIDEPIPIRTVDNNKVSEELWKNDVASLFWGFREDTFMHMYSVNTIGDIFSQPGLNLTWSSNIDFASTPFTYKDQLYDTITINWMRTEKNLQDAYISSIVFNTNEEINNNNFNEHLGNQLVFQTPPQGEQLKKMAWIFNNNQKTRVINDVLYFYLGSLILNPSYTHVRFQSQEKPSHIYCKEDSNYVTHYNTDTLWYLINLDDFSNEIPANLKAIPNSWYDIPHKYFIKIPNIYSTESLIIKEAEIYADFYRNPIKEELEFARIADECPWLENKLFDFNYFYNHKIINRKQYQDLNVLIQDDLRKANAQLLLYSQLYYQELKNKTEKIAKLESQIDTLGAIFNAEFIQPFNEKKPFESSGFVTAYSSLFKDTTLQAANITLLDYAKTISGYINKYINAEQDFLKNMYLFTNYFNQKLEPNKKLYKYSVSIPEPTESSDEIYTFSTPGQYTLVTASDFNYIDDNGLPTISIYQKEEDNYCAISPDDIVSSKSLLDNNIYYVENLESWTELNEDHKYNRDTQYFEKQWVYTMTDEEVKDYNSVDLPAYDLNDQFEIYRLDIWNKKAYIRSRNHIVRKISGASLSFKVGNYLWDIDSTSLIEFYEPVDIYQLKCNYLYKELQKDSTGFASDKYRRVTCALKSIGSMNPLGTGSIFDGGQIKSNLEPYFRSAKNDVDKTPFDTLYKENFPLTSLQFKDSNKYYPVDFINVENAQNFYRRISVSNGWQTALGVGASATAAIGATAFGPVGLGLIAASALVLLVAQAVWKYGPTSWGTEGWTYQDVYGAKINEEFNSSWTGISSDIYIKSASAWSKLNPEIEGTTRPEIWNLNYAQNIILTYPSITSKQDRAQNYYYEPYYWRRLSDNDLILKEEDYQAVIATSSNEFFKEDLVTGRIDAIENYPLGFVLVPFPTSDFDFEKHSTPTLSSFLSISGVKPTGNQKIFVFHKEDYDYETVETIRNDENAVNINNISSYAASVWYDNQHKKVDWTQVSGLASGFFVKQQNRAYKPIKDLSKVSEDVLYFKRHGSKYSPVYTLKQLLSKNNIYTQTSNMKTYYSFNQLDKVDLSVNVYKKTDGHLEFSRTINKTFNLLQPEVTDLSATTNGMFWATYINYVDQPFLMQEAMLIETNLTEYWTNAYYASKNCRYFLPEFWQPMVNGQVNNFSSEIVLGTQKNNKLTDIKLLNTYIPIVECVSNQPTLSIQYIDNEKHYSNTTGYDYIYNSQTSVSSLCVQHPWLQDIISYLGIHKENCAATILDYQSTYYSRIGGGKTWYDMLNAVGGSLFISYKNFGGWYDTIIKVLNTKYVSCSVDQYNMALDEHNRIWKQIYHSYPNLIYEKTFEYKDAVTSEQLLDAAKFAFRQYNDVERQYNIQTIDLAGLKGYIGQDLRIGDAIELDADELYDAYDDIKTSLLQYLYISDISYDLRSDANIKLTVNNIKYADKVIGELVKLIR